MQTVVAVVLALAMGITAWAEYTKSSQTKRVIGAYAASGYLFSSNYMRPTKSLDNLRTVYFGDADGELTADVTVCNYAQSNPEKHYGRDIAYTLSWRLVTISEEPAGQEGQEVRRSVVLYTGNDLTQTSVSYQNGSVDSHPNLPGGSSSTHHFTVTFDPEMLKKPVYLEITATPTQGYSDLPAGLSVLLNVGLRAKETPVTWRGAWSEADEGHTPAEYDGLNYQISGSGQGSFTLKWKTDKVVLSQASREKELPQEAQSGTEDGWVTLTFEVNSDDRDWYQIQFYQAAKTAWTGTEAWVNGADEWVKYSFQPAAPAPVPTPPESGE